MDLLKIEQLQLSERAVTIYQTTFFITQNNIANLNHRESSLVM